MAQQTQEAQELERLLVQDLETAANYFADDDSAADLYRALTNNIWFRSDPNVHVALSWRHAEDVVNELRAKVDRPPLTLAQTGHEGEVIGRAADILPALGWQHQPLNTDEHDPNHVESAEHAPPVDNPQRQGFEPGYPRFDRAARREGARTGFKHRGG